MPNPSWPLAGKLVLHAIPVLQNIIVQLSLLSFVAEIIRDIFPDGYELSQF
jgi:hypothetical protein